MALNKVVRRELEVAFSKHSQPAWFKILKYCLLALVLYLFWGSKFLWILIPGLVAVAMVLHFWFRYKTNKWTKTYGIWKYRKSKLNDD